MDMLVDGKCEQLLAAITAHHDQKADDRCIEDDDALYRAAGLPPCDRRVGDKFEMLKNCARFIDRRCEGGCWPSYADLEAKIRQLVTENASLSERLAVAMLKAGDPLSSPPEWSE